MLLLSGTIKLTFADDGTKRSASGTPTSLCVLRPRPSVSAFVSTIKQLSLVTLVRFSVLLIAGFLSVHGPGTRRHLIGSTDAVAWRGNYCHPHAA